MNLSYYSRLKEQIEEAKKRANPGLNKDLSVVIVATLDPPGSPESWKDLVSGLLHAEEWGRAGSEAPSLLFISSTKAHFFFNSLPDLVPTLISVVSSLCIRLGSRLCLCTSVYLSNDAEVFAYFVLIEEEAYRSQLEKITGKAMGHLTEEEIRGELKNCEHGGDWQFVPGKFYTKTNTGRRGKSWVPLESKENTLVYQKKLSFAKFSEHSSALFGRP